MTTQDWIDSTPGMIKLLADLKCHAENTSLEDLERMFAISIRQYLEDRT